MGRHIISSTDRDRIVKLREREYEKLKRLVDLGNKPPLSRSELIYFGKLLDPEYPDYIKAPRPASLDFTGMSMHPKSSPPSKAPAAPVEPAAPKAGPPLTKDELKQVFQATKEKAIQAAPPQVEAGAGAPPEETGGERIGPYTWAEGGKLTKYQVEKIVKAAGEHGTRTTQARNKLIILLMADLGLGMEELRRVGPETVNLEKAVYYSLVGDIPVKKVSRRAWDLLEGTVKLGQNIALDNTVYYRLVRSITEAAGEKVTAAQLIKYGKAHRAQHMRTRTGHAQAITGKE